MLKKKDKRLKTWDITYLIQRSSDDNSKQFRGEVIKAKTLEEARSFAENHRRPNERFALIGEVLEVSQ